jgi:2-polyprenyl-3-methyl-5-hydroxy-6-metoxy-1,4-benzoquinol methylase
MNVAVTTLQAAWSPASLTAVARDLSRDGPLLLRLKQRHRPRICPLHRIIPLVPTGSYVLDVGCGGGLFLALLVRLGRIRRGVGFDASEPAIAMARQMVQRLGNDAPRLTFERVAMGDPWPTGPFDVVSIIDVMHHVRRSEQRGLLNRAAACLAPDGLLIYKDVGLRPRWRAWASRLHDVVFARELIHLTPIEDVESWAADLNLHSVHAEDINQLWYGHELRVFQRHQDKGAP